MSSLEIPEDLDLSNLNQKEKLILLDKVNLVDILFVVI